MKIFKEIFLDAKLPAQIQNDTSLSSIISDDDSLSFFMLAHKQPKATAYCLQTVREFYKEEHTFRYHCFSIFRFYST